MIVLVSKYDKTTGMPVTVRRDLTSDEIQAMLAAEHPGAVAACGEYSCYPGTDSTARIRAYAPSCCRASEPVTMRMLTEKGTLAFRGTVVLCGEHGGEDCSIYDDIMSDGEKGRIEPVYQNDAICIPSRDEWLLVPKEIRGTLAGGLWCWTRDIESRSASIVGSNGDRGSYCITVDSGGVVAFLRLPCLPDDVARAIRDRTDADGVACFKPYSSKEPSGKPDCRAPYLVRVTNDVYGIGAFDRHWGPAINDLACIDKDPSKTYHESSLRAELNGTYLMDLIKSISNSIKEGN